MIARIEEESPQPPLPAPQQSQTITIPASFSYWGEDGLITRSIHMPVIDDYDSDPSYNEGPQAPPPPRSPTPPPVPWTSEFLWLPGSLYEPGNVPYPGPPTPEATNETFREEDEDDDDGGDDGHGADECGDNDQDAMTGWMVENHAAGNEIDGDHDGDVQDEVKANENGQS